jgi:chromosome partitioning protein
MKSIVTINFKGGVGKTTVTWCLGEAVSRQPNKKAIIFDLDAQMSLTQAIALNEETGWLRDTFSKWYDNSVNKKKTIFDALDQFTKVGSHFDFPVGFDFIYQISENYHFVPSNEELYWTELELFDRNLVKDFIRRLLSKIDNSPQLPKYDFAFFDCPPSFSLLSYSVLSYSDLVIIPINPDFFASKGLNLLLKSIKLRIEPFPVPRIGVLMNKARPTTSSRRKYSIETERYWDDAQRISEIVSKKEGIKVKCFEAFIPERQSIKRAIQQGMPTEFYSYFNQLLKEVEEFINEPT